MHSVISKDLSDLSVSYMKATSGLLQKHRCVKKSTKKKLEKIYLRLSFNNLKA